MRILASLAAVAVALTLGACSSNDDTSKPLTLQQLASKVGCTDLQTGDEAIATESGSCTLNGVDIYLAVFSDNKSRDSYFGIAKAAGGVFAEGNRWVIYGDSRGIVHAAATSAGGKVVN